MEDGDADLLLEELRIVAEVLGQRTSVDRDLRRHVRLLVEEPVDVRLLGVVILDDDCDIVERARDLFGEGVQRGAHVRLERRHHSTTRASSAFSVWSLFSASSQAADWGPYSTSGVISSPRCAGRQCRTIASGAPSASSSASMR